MQNVIQNLSNYRLSLLSRWQYLSTAWSTKFKNGFPRMLH